MMVEKKIKYYVYKALSMLNLPIDSKSGKSTIRVIFSGQNNTYTTCDEWTQKQIESSHYYKINEIILDKVYYNTIMVEVDDEEVESLGKLTKEDDEGKEAEVEYKEYEPKVYEDVTTVQQASEVLRQDYNIPKSNTRVKADVLKHADALKVSFPNLYIS